MFLAYIIQLISAVLVSQASYSPSEFSDNNLMINSVILELE